MERLGLPDDATDVVSQIESDSSYHFIAFSLFLIVTVRSVLGSIRLLMKWLADTSPCCSKSPGILDIVALSTGLFLS
jgi:hypothetical protein